LNPGKNKITVTAQTFQNYKSALKWWHEYDSVAMEKVGCHWPELNEDHLKKALGSYRRDIGNKKRRGIMPLKEGIIYRNN
jgi:hypothetical protein